MVTIGFDTKIAFSKDAGFSLFELVLVMTLTGIMVAVVAPLITQPVTSYIDVSRRTTLVDAAESAIRRMQRDLRHALPNSIRIIGGTTLESLYAVDGGRYRTFGSINQRGWSQCNFE